jgi:Reverse transcriptase (RNA-dependent DNA polymerase)
MLKPLLQRGYLPQELPPPFNTLTFGKLFSKRGRFNLPPNPTKESKLVVHNLARTGSLRRQLAIPGPLHYIQLCNTIIANFTSLQSKWSASPYSESTPKTGSFRAYSRKTEMNDLPLRRVKNRSGSRYLLKADISRFYPSIYTHSIPWAFHTKPIAKGNHSNTLYGNLIDKNIRESQDKQTFGMPIGPDSSFLIAEAILSDVDEKIKTKAPNARGFRYVDDYEFSFSSIGDAESFLGILQTLLGEYELALNPKKTQIIELPYPANSPWASELRVFQISTTGRRQASDLIRYFDMSLDLFKKMPDENVLKYCISRLSSVQIDADNWALVEGYILQVVALESGALPQGLRLIREYQAAGLPCDLPGLERVLCEIIERHIPQSHGSEVAWSIWGMIEFKINIPSIVAQLCIDYYDSVVSLVISDAQTRGLISGTVQWGSLHAKLATPLLYDDCWLFSYEADVKNWFRTSLSVTSGDPGFAALASNGISFYDGAYTLLSPAIPRPALAGSSGGSPNYD